MMATIDPRDSCFLVVEPSRLHSHLLGKPNEATTATKFQLLDDAALAGLGPALLADRLIGSNLKAGRLVDLFPDHDVAANSFETAAWIVYPSRSYLPAKTRVMIDFLKIQAAKISNLPRN